MISDNSTLETIFWGLLIFILVLIIIKMVVPIFRKSGENQKFNQNSGDLKTIESTKKDKFIFDINDTLGLSGEVFRTIPASKIETGAIKVNFQNVVYELKARSADEKKIYAGNTVKIVKIEDEIVIVEKI